MGYLLIMFKKKKSDLRKYFFDDLGERFCFG